MQVLFEMSGMISDFKASLQVTKFNYYFHYLLVFNPGVNLIKLLYV